MSDYFGDTVYEVWRSGGNPDHVDREECREDERYGSYPEETAERIVDRQIRQQRRSEVFADDDGASR